MTQFYGIFVKVFYKWILLLSTCSLLAVTQNVLHPQRDTTEYAKNRVNSFKVTLHQLLEKFAFQRRTAVVDERTLPPSISFRQLDVEPGDSVTAGCVARMLDPSIVFALGSTNVLHLFRNFSFVRVYEFPRSRRFISLQAFEYGREVWLITHQADKKNRHSIRLYEFKSSSPTLHYDQKILLRHPSLVAYTKLGFRVFVAVATANAVRPDFTLFQWVRTKFEEVFRRGDGNNCAALTVWNMEGAVYVACSFAGRRETVVEKFITDVRWMLPVQLLEVNAHVMTHFEDAGSHFLVCGTIANSIVIYWWSGSEFLQLQELSVGETVADVIVKRFSKKVLIVIVLKDEVKFLIQQTSRDYVTAGTVPFPSQNGLKSAILWSRGNFLYLKPIFNTAQPSLVHEISLHYIDPVPGKERTFEDCLETVYEKLKEREKAVNEAVSRAKFVWLPSVETELSSIEVNGDVISKAAVTVRSLRFTTPTLSLDSLWDIHNNLKDNATELQSLVTKSVLKSTDQIIEGKVHFKDLTLTHEATSVEKLRNHTSLNSIPTHRLQFALRKKGHHQRFLSSVKLANAKCGSMTTTKLNEKMMEDYVFLTGVTQNLTGHLTFGNITAKTLFVNSGVINGLGVENLVLTSGNQIVKGMKLFTVLNSETIRTENFNTTKLKKIKDVVYRDARNITRFLNFTSTVIINGDLNLTSLNGNFFSSLLTNSVKRDGHQEYQSIGGHKRFRSVRVEGDLVIFGHINNISTRNLMTIHTNQIISGPVSFSVVTKFENIETDSVNACDLSQTAVKKSENATVSGVKTFSETLNVSDVSLGENVTIDSFDPSLEITEIIRCNQSIESNVDSCLILDSVTMGNVFVLRDAEVRNTDEDFPLLDLIGNVWLRSKEQNVPQLAAKILRVVQLEVSRVNDIKVENLVLVNGNNTIDSPKEFEAVEIETLILKDRTYINFTELWDSDIRLRIFGNITLEDAVLESDLTINGAINGIIPEFTSSENFQELEGEFMFEEIMVEDLNSKDLKFLTVNDFNFTDYVERSVVLSKRKNILNKSFEVLKGSAMEINGTLNNESLERIATINTAQKIPGALMFNNSASFKKVDVKNFFGDIQLDSVVHRDDVRSVSNKIFNGFVNAFHVSGGGGINGVNITELQLFAFNRSGNNAFQKRLTVNTWLEAKDNIGSNLANIRMWDNLLNVIPLAYKCTLTYDRRNTNYWTIWEVSVSGGTVDGVDLKSIIRLNDSLKLESLNASSVVANNLNVTGLINKCDLTLVLREGLKKKKISQTVTAKVHVKSLVINGSLTMGYVNGVWAPDLVPLLNRSFDSESGDFTFENVDADYVTFPGLVNNIDIDFLTEDSVRRNAFQVIKGQKSFSDISTTDVSIQSLQSNRVCGINISHLFDSSVSRMAAHRQISLTKLPGILAERVTVRGTLNNLTLPEDVVLTNTSDALTGEVHINSTLNVTGGFYTFGDINGVNLKKFLMDRVTLSAAENVSSQLTFKEDAYVKGNITINGLVNGIRIKDIVNKSQSLVVTGHLNFTELRLQSSLTVKGTVNGVHLNNLKDKLLLSSRNEHLKDTVVFASLNLSSLICSSINGANMTDFYSNIHKIVHRTDDKLDTFTALIQGHQDSLRNQSDAAEHPLSLYGYFEIQQFLSVGSVRRFLPVYEYGTVGPKYELQVNQMVIWVNKTNDKCRKTKSLVADVLQNGTLSVTKIMQGKIFPFSLSVERDGVVGFYVQADHAQRCHPGKRKRVVITTFFASGVTQTRKIDSPTNATLLDVQVLEVRNVFLITTYAREGFSGRIILHRYDSKNNTWSFHQEFHGQELASIDIISVEESSRMALYRPPDIFLAVAGQTNNPGISVYEWDFDTDKFAFKTDISTSASSSALWVDHDKMLFLLLAKESTRVRKENNTWVNVFSEPLEVYVLVEDELVLNHTVNVRGVQSLELFALAGEVFVLGSSSHMETVYVIQFRGYNGFESVQEIPAPGITSAHVFTVESHLYVALCSSTGHSRILKAVIRGGRLNFE